MGLPELPVEVPSDYVQTTGDTNDQVTYQSHRGPKPKPLPANAPQGWLTTQEEA